VAGAERDAAREHHGGGGLVLLAGVQQCTNDCAYWGLVQRGTDPDKPRITKQYYAMSQFTKWTPKGSYMLRVDDDCEHGVMASYDPKADRLAVHVLNQRTSKASIELCFQGFSTPEEKDPACSLTRTSANENAASIKCDKLEGTNRGSALPCFHLLYGPLLLLHLGLRRAAQGPQPLVLSVLYCCSTLHCTVLHSTVCTCCSTVPPCCHSTAVP